MSRNGFFVLMVIVLILGLGCGKKETTIPRVVSTFPVNGERAVDPSIKEISVTFNEEMTDGNWSWAYDDKTKFPQVTGQAYYTDNYTRNVIPVKLEPNKEYVIWINSAKFNNFKDKSGNSAVPFKLTFKTRQM